MSIRFKIGDYKATISNPRASLQELVKAIKQLFPNKKIEIL